MTISNFRTFVLSSFFLGSTMFSAGAQSTTQGAILGTVFDATNAAVPGATVVIHNDGTNAEQKLTSNDAGYFKAPQLAPGTYTVTITAVGFTESRTDKVVVEVNNVTEVSPHLSTGAESTVVEVTAAEPVIKFDSPSFGGHLSNEEIENIPINNRRWSSLSLLTPGVTNDASGFGLISFRAISATLNNVLIDGADDNQAFYGEERGRTRAGYSTAQIAVREFQVNTGVYSAEFGRAVGGVVNSVTKSGTNQIHGEAYFYHRDQQWSASNPFVFSTLYNTSTSVATRVNVKPKDKRNQFGFGVGGPLIKDTVFGFYAFDQYRRVFPGYGTAANAAFYNDPSTTDQATLASRLTNETGTATTPAQALTVYRNYISALNGDLGLVPRIGFQTINTPKIDWQISGKHHASFLYHRLRWDSPGGVQTQSSVNYSVDGFGTDFVKLDYGLAKLDSVVTARIANELRYQYGRELNDEGRQPNSAFTNQYLLPASGVPVQISLPSTAFSLGQQYYSFRYALPDERKWQIGDTASVLFGKHNLKFGIDLLHNYDLQTSVGNSTYAPNGGYTYGTLLAFISDLSSPQHGGCGTGSGAAYVAVGCYSTYRQTFSPQNPGATQPFASTYDISSMDSGYFAQDDWKLTPRLTLNLGVRYDYQRLPEPIARLTVSSFANSLNRPSDKNNFSPRLGFAYDPFGLGTTVVRGGMGFYYGHIPNTALFGSRFTTGSPNGQLSYTITPSASAPLLPSALTTPPTTTLVPDIQYLDNHFQNPYTEQFDLAVQQNIGLNTVLSVSYLGSLGRELPNSLNLNINPANAYTVNYTVAGSGNCGPLACGAVVPVKVYGQKVQTGASTTATAPATLNTSYAAIYGGVSNVNTAFHALSVEITKRASKYISYDANYTWSHATDYNQTQLTSFAANSWFDPYGNTRANYGNSILNVKHRAVGWMILNIPGSSISYLKAATNGWSVKPAVQIQSGLPYSAVVNSTTTAPQCATVGCLQANAGGLSGTGVTYIPALGRNTFNYPRDIVVDLRLQKDFKLGERFNLQFIGEAFNVANHLNATTINTTAYNITPSTTGPTATLTYQPTFGSVTNANNNFAYSPRNLQAGARLFF